MTAFFHQSELWLVSVLCCAKREALQQIARKNVARRRTTAFIEVVLLIGNRVLATGI
jgi:hypothetical protein